jgi:putative MATE family efflux protein
VETETYSKRLINRDIFHLIIPSVMENILQLLAGLVITAMVGRLLASDIAAQGISNRIYQTFFALFRGLGTGATVIVALNFGKKELTKCRRVIEQAYLTTIPVAGIVVLLLSLFPHTILRLFTDDMSLINLGASYSRITAWAIPFMILICFNTAAFNGQGNTRTPMMIAMVLNVVNIIVGYISIFGLFGIGGFGIIGAAVSTVISQIVGASLGLYLLYNKKGFLRRIACDHKFFSLDRPEISALYATGIPAAAENVFWQLSAIIMSRVILSYGSNYYAAYQLGLNAEMLTEMPAMGFVVAATTLSARAIGQRDPELYRAYFNRLTRIALYVGIAASAILFIFCYNFMGFLTNKADLIQIGGGYVFYMGFAQIPQVLSKVFNGVIRSSGGKRVPMYISFIGIWIVRVPFILLFGLVLRLDIKYIWITIAADQISRLVISLVYMRKRRITHYVDKLIEEEA